MPCFLDISFNRRRFRHPLTKIITTIGRHSNCDLCLQDSRLSRIHLTIARLDVTKYWLFDGIHEAYNPSRNGIWVNGIRVNGSILLNLKDKIVFGKINAEFDCEFSVTEIDKLTVS